MVARFLIFLSRVDIILKKTEFAELLENKLIYLDGATGSMLIKNGMPSGVCPEKWIIDNREVMIAIQMDYLLAGTNIIYAPTFTSNSIKLENYGLQDQVQRINQELVHISKEAVRRVKEKYPDKLAFVAGDMTMTGIQLKPIGPMEFEALVDIYKEQIHALVQSGVDLLVVETMTSLQECRAALLAAKETCELPVMVSMSFDENGRSLYGTDAKTAVVTLQYLGADAIGVNCSTGPDKMVEIIQNMTQVTEVPIICKPNAGMPSLAEDGSTVYSMNEQDFASHMKEAVRAGARIIGGCCGTSPQYIEALVHATKDEPLMQYDKPQKHVLTSERQCLAFDFHDGFMIVGERINPTGKKKLQEELRNGSFEMVRDFAEEQELRGASILDVNMGMSGIDEKTTMLQAIEEVTSTVNLPLSLDTSNIDVMEQALRHYPGRALINSISLEKEKFDHLLPLAKKYGAMFILLPLSDEGLPKNIDEKKQIIRKIVDRALELGMRKSDIIVDGLVTTVGANKNAALETLETIRFCKEEMGLMTICGLSNISFGLPERSFVNTTFLTMAISAGLTMAIANPNQDMLVNNAFAADLLLNKEGADLRYIERIHLLSEIGTIATEPQKKTESDATKDRLASESRFSNATLQTIYDSVMKGNKSSIVKYTQSAVEAGVDAKVILNEVLLPAINQVGEYFDKGRYFLPQLIGSAETMKLAIEHIEPLLMSGDGADEMPVIVIATVEGDIHDIGKNLVTLMLKNHGFRVYDLGKDVPKEKIIEAAIQYKAEIIALSALMTTTMREMKHVIEYAREKGVKAKVMIGGAVITQDYADEIGADGFSKDAADAVKLAKKLCNK